MNSCNRLIMVSNRLPISVERTGDTYAAYQSSGGLVTALRCVFHSYSAVGSDGPVPNTHQRWKTCCALCRIPTLRFTPYF